jgi:hypothetical protein
MSRVDLFVILGAGVMLALGNFTSWFLKRGRDRKRAEMKRHIERIYD